MKTQSNKGTVDLAFGDQVLQQCDPEIKETVREPYSCPSCCLKAPPSLQGWEEKLNSLVVP